jgi:hypothetical protein
MTLIEKILQLKGRFSDPVDAETIDGWLGEAKRLFLIKSLKDHDGIKFILEQFTSEVEKINNRLQNSYSKELSDTERDRLLDKRDLANKYINIFKNTDEQLEKIEQLVDSEG